MFNSFPFFRFSVFLIVGIVVEMLLSIPLQALITFSSFAFSLFLYAFYKRKWWQYQGIMMAFILISLGGILVIGKTHKPNINLLRADFVKATITEEPQQTKKGFKVEAIVNHLKIGDSIFTCNEKMMLFTSDSLPYGSEIWIKGALNIPSPALIPHGFDYKKYLESKQIFFTKYAHIGNYIALPQNKGNWLMSFSISLRANLVNKIKSFVKGKNESSIASAMVLGVKGNWDDTLRNDYARSGTLHILAVSGMHVGLLYASLLWLFASIRQNKLSLTFTTFLIISSLCLYCIITGMSASVVRAVAMCIILEIAALFGRRPSLMNTVFLSAFVLLCLDPFLIKDIGFQLSYVALIGIVVWQSYFDNIIQSKYKIITATWSVFSTTLAAQIAVAPLGLLYFHQFPNLFWLSNIVVIPLSIVILYAGITLIIISPIPVIASILGSVIKYLIEWVNLFIGFVANLPFSVTNDIHISWLYVIGMYLILLLITQAFQERNKLKLWLSISLVASIGIFESLEIIRLKNSKTIYVLYENKTPIIHFQNGIPKAAVISNSRRNRNFKIADKTVTQISEWHDNFKSNPTDILIVDLKHLKNTETLLGCYTPKTIILTPSVSAKLEQEMQQLARQRSIICYVMREQGFFEKSLTSLN